MGHLLVHLLAGILQLTIAARPAQGHRPRVTRLEARSNHLGECRPTSPRSPRVQGSAIRDVESELEAMKREHDPLASHIFVSRRHYQNVNDTKSGKRREMNARLSFDTACELGFRGSLDEWERLMGAVARR